MEDEINLWLKSKRKFSTGLELFDKYARIRGLSRIFHVGGPTPKNKQTLAYELNKLLRKLNEVPRQNTVITPPTEATDLVPEIRKELDMKKYMATLFVFICGILIMWVTKVIFGG